MSLKSRILGDKILGNKITVGNVIGSTGVAIGPWATANVYIQKVPKPRKDFVLERPEPASHFQDRRAALDKLLADLQPGRVVTLCGPEGIGKSALAAEAVRQLAPMDDLPPERFPRGILFHDFKKEPKADLALEHIVRSFGEELKPTLVESAQRVLASRLVLLIFDNAEEADNLQLVLDIRNQSGILIISQQRQIPADERQDLLPLPPDAAVALLRAWGGARANDETAVRQISDLVGRLPLALHLIGEYLSANEENATEYLAWLTETPLVALNEATRHEQSVPLLLAQSLTQVSEQARQVLGVVGLLALAPFTHESIVAALKLSAQEARSALNQLVNNGLLLRPSELYEVTHALLHTYARIQLAPPIEVVERLATYYSTLIDEHPSEFPQLNQTLPHVLALLRIGNEQKAWTSVINLAKAIDNFLDTPSRWIDRITTSEAGLTAARALEDKLSEEAWLGSLSSTYFAIGQVEKALAYSEQALTIAKEIDHRAYEGAALSSLGSAYFTLGQVEKALVYYEQALAIVKEVGNRTSEGIILGFLGNVYFRLGQVEKALVYFEQALIIAKEIGDRSNEGIAPLCFLGGVYFTLGQVEKALVYFEQALTIAKEVGSHTSESVILSSLGQAYVTLGQVEKAIEFHQQALALSKENGYRTGEGVALSGLADAYFTLGQVEKALAYSEQALTSAKESRNRGLEGICLGGLGSVYVTLGQVEKAIAYYQQALTIAKELGDPALEGKCLGDLGSAYVTLSQVEKAIEYHQQALAIFKEVGNRMNEGIALSNLGDAYRTLGQVEKAIEYYQQALTIVKEFDDRMNEGIALSNLGDAYRTLGQVEKAIEYYQQVLTIVKESGDRRREGTIIGVIWATRIQSWGKRLFTNLIGN